MIRYLLVLFCLPMMAIELRFAKSLSEIDLVQGKEVLVSSFMKGYENVPLTDLNPNFKCIGDVRRFYENYFESELGHYRNGELLWVQAFDGDKLLGWATFELESSHEAYMNLLVVAPGCQKNGIGKSLVFSICNEVPQIDTIHVLVRKVNAEGEKFYRHIGFADFDYPREDNFVDPSLLSGFRWQKKMTFSFYL
ncbi:MAG: GNAT family N-acetyltransferase [Parachlamydiales bacterium]|nr:GNAT family N-acetyltransferase [Parachlamydiales bacterium]